MILICTGPIFSPRTINWQNVMSHKLLLLNAAETQIQLYLWLPLGFPLAISTYISKLHGILGTLATRYSHLTPYLIPKNGFISSTFLSFLPFFPFPIMNFHKCVTNSVWIKYDWLGWRVDRSLWRTNFRNSQRSWPWSSTISTQESFHSFQVVLGRERIAKVLMNFFT